MTGDQADMVSRLRRLLPVSWFPADDATPVLSATLAGAADVFREAYALLMSILPEIRLTTATSGFIDLFANDYFDNRMRRRSWHSDATYRAAVSRNLFPLRGTATAIRASVQALLDLPPTGYGPEFIELRNPYHTGAYASCRVAPVSNNPSVLGYKVFRGEFPNFGLSGNFPTKGVYGSIRMGTQTLVNLDWSVGATNATPISDLLNELDRARPVGATIWLRLTSGELPS